MDWTRLTNDQLDEFLNSYNHDIPASREDKINTSNMLFQHISKIPGSNFTEPVVDLYISHLPTTKNVEVPPNIYEIPKDHPLWSALYVEYPQYDRLIRILTFVGQLGERTGREEERREEPRQGGKEKGKGMTKKEFPTLPELAPISGKPYPLTNLICGQFRHPKDFFKIFQKQPCTQIGEKIAKSLIRVAATRIFANPYQSILELPVNSLDAYAKKSGQEQVGKFGLGFYSTLYWLIGYPERRLLLESSSNEGHWQLQLWSDDDNELTYQLNILSVEPQSPMVQITIDASSSPFPSEKFMAQLEKLEYTDKAKVIINGNQINAVQDVSDQIEITLTDRQIQVTDWALGIPISVLFQSLLVPSVSEKTIGQSLSITHQINPEISQMTPSSSPKFKILVGQIVVVDLPINTNYDVLLSLSLNIRLPTSRDDIIISDQNWPEIQAGLTHLVRYGLHYKTLIPIQLSLKSYIEYTGSSQNKHKMSVYLNSIPELVNNYVLIPPNFRWLYDQIKPNFYIESLNHSIPALEQDLISRLTFLDNLYFGKLVIGVPFPADDSSTNPGSSSTNPGSSSTNPFPIGSSSTTNPQPAFQTNSQKNKIGKSTSGGTGKILFIDSVYAQENPNFVADLPLITINDSLIPMSMNFGQAISDQIIQKIGPTLELLSPKLSDLLISVVLRAMKLETYFDFNSKDVVYEYYATNTYITLFLGGEELAIDFLVEQFAIFSKMEATNYSYGLGRSLLEFGSEDRYFQISLMKRLTLIKDYPNKDKLVNYALEMYRSYPYKIIGFSIYLKNFGNVIFEPFEETLHMWSKTFLPVYDKFLTLSTTPEEFYILVIVIEMFILRWLHLLQAANCEEDIIAKKMIEISDKLLMLVPQFLKILNTEFDPKRLIKMVQDKAAGEISEEEFFEYGGGDNAAEIIKGYQFAIFRPVFTRLSAQFDIKFQIDVLPGEYPQLKGKYKRFRLSSLIGLLFKTPINPDNFMNELIRANIRGTPKIEQLQLIEVAVNENTTKDFWEAVITELVQNSVDAIRPHLISGKRDITIELKQKVVKGKPSLIWSIEDQIGIPQRGYLGLMIPFVSTKSPLVFPDGFSEGTPTTGEIGSGFFNVYRQADEVRIESMLDNYEVTIVDVPIRDQDGRTIDLDKKVFVNPNKKGGRHKSGTKITLLLQFETEQERDLELGKITYLTKEMLKLVPEDFHILFNDNQVQIKTYPLPRHDMALASTIFSEGFTSMVLTRGIPFRTLSDYLGSTEHLISEYVKPEIDSNLMIDFQMGFTPVSNRTQINIDREYGESFDEWFKQTVYLTLLNKYIKYKDIRDSYIPNSSSTNYINQLYFADSLDSPSNISEWILYSKFFRDKPLAIYLNDLIAIINLEFAMFEGRFDRDDDGSLFVNERVEARVKSLNLTDMEVAVIKIWFSPKHIIDPEDEERLDYERFLQEEMAQGLTPSIIVIPEILSEFTQVFTQLYWEIGQNLEKQGKLAGTKFSTQVNPPKITWSLNIDELGLYNSGDHEITLNYFKYRDTQLEEQLLSLTSGDLSEFNNKWLELQNKPGYKELAGMIYPAPTLIHELAHAWRREEHDQLNVHDAIQLKIGNQEGRFPFDDAAIKVSLEIMSQDFIQNLWIRLQR